jgi:Na+-translocating ferredoxin:NAD+ oxidoreductase RNF subunit RnfB
MERDLAVVVSELEDGCQWAIQRREHDPIEGPVCAVGGGGVARAIKPILCRLVIVCPVSQCTTCGSQSCDDVARSTVSDGL